MVDNLRFWFLGVIGILTLGVLFAHSGCEIYNEYQDCISYYFTADKVSNILINNSTFNIDYNLYIDCVSEQKNQKIFDYSEIRNFCFNALTVKKPTFNVKCHFELNNPILTVNCKGLYPTKDFLQKAELQFDGNKLQIIPIVVLNSDYSLSKPEFSFTQLKLNLIEQNIKGKVNSIELAPLKIEIKDSSEVSFLNLPMQNLGLDEIYKSYLDCLTIKTIFSKPIENNIYVIKKSGYEFRMTKDDLINSCVDDLRFSFIVDFENYNLKKKEFRAYLDNKINESLSANDYSVNYLNNVFEEILNEHSEYLLSTNKYKTEENILKLSLDSDYLFEQLLRLTKNLNASDKSIILESATPTILKNKEDTISIRRKDNLDSILTFFESDINKLNDPEIVFLYSGIKEIVLKNYFKNNLLGDICKVSFILTPKSISLENFSFDFTNSLKYCLGDNEIIISSKENTLQIYTKDYNFNTTLTLEFKDKILVSGKEVNLLDSKITNNKNIKEIALIYDVVPIYVLTKERKGKLLGIINITERITEKYNASNIELYSTEKPWWDFLVIYR